MTATSTQTPLRIPYGVADFIKLRRGNENYVDKTHYLPLLESAGRFLFLIRPRRFGKSLLQSMMECYYCDLSRVEQFDGLFHKTWIAAHVTPEKGRYLVLRFDFSMMGTTQPGGLRQAFDDHIRIRLDNFFHRYAGLFPATEAAAVLCETGNHRRLEHLFSVIEQRELGLNLSPYFSVHSEQEQGGGFVDLYLAPFYFRYPDMRHAYLIELKYLNRNEDTPAKRQRLIEKAEAQLHRYRSDPRVEQHLGPATLHPIVLFYSGWELVYRAELEPMSAGEGNWQ